MKVYFVRQEGGSRKNPEGNVPAEVVVYDPAAEELALSINHRLKGIVVRDEVWGSLDKEGMRLAAFVDGQISRLNRTYGDKTLLVVTHDKVLRCLPTLFPTKGSGNRGDPMLVELPDWPRMDGIKRATDPIL